MFRRISHAYNEILIIQLYFKFRLILYQNNVMTNNTADTKS